MRRAESGAALLEAIVALAILGGTGVTLVGQVRQTYEAVRRADAAERRFVEASEFLDAVALWPREDLDRRLGDRRNGPWRLEITRVLEAIYEVAVRDSTGRHTLAATTVYRRPDAQPTP
jgi:type II secretory pathway pseudopilin PulG